MVGCRRAGIQVAYCAEQFENDGSPVSTIVKGVKRAMAGEYSRELSAKVTTQNLSLEQLHALSDEVGSDQSLLVCCSAFHGITASAASQRWPNLTLKKIPKMVLARCEWGHDDYSLNVANLPIAERPEKTEEPLTAHSTAARKTKKSAAASTGQGGLFGENE